jgi:hypothetical protein
VTARPQQVTELHEDVQAEIDELLDDLESLPGGLIADDELASLPPPEWLIDGFLPANGLAMLYGVPEGGKTFLALDLAFAIACKKTWHGRAIRRGGPVLYVTAEGVPGLNPRVEAWKYVHDVTGRAGVYFVREGINLLEPTAGHRLLTIASLLPLPPALAVFDTLHRLTPGGKENDGDDASRVIGTLDVFRRETGATCFLLHHPNAAGQRERGHTAYRGAMDAMWGLRVEDDARILECEKMKDGPHFEPFRFVLQPVQRSCAVAVSSGLSKVSGRLTKNQRKCLEALRDIDTGRGVSPSAWIDAAGVPRASFHRTAKQLVDAGYVKHSPRGDYMLLSSGVECLSQVSLGLKKVS